METPDYSGMKLLFTAFSVAEGSEEVAGYEFVKQYGATDISALYWGDEEYASKIPDDITKIKVDGNNAFDPNITEGYDLIFRHQTTRPDLLKSPTTTNTNEFFKYCPSEIIGVTGTKGKGTTATLISEILDSAGISNQLLGNMGNTAIRYLDKIDPEEVVVFEISSFQLWDLQYSPHIAVVLMMDVDHQDVHNSISEYIAAKGNIARHQNESDIVIYHPTNEMSAQVVGTPKGRAKRYMTEEGAYINEEQILIDGAEIMWAEQVGLRGEHNLENVCAAITAAWEYTQDTAAISNAVAEFKGLEHRLEPLGEVDEIQFYNDSFSVVPIATEAAIKSFDLPITLIVGGYDRGTSFQQLARTIAESTVKSTIVIGAVKERLSFELQNEGVGNIVISEASNMQEILDEALQRTEPNSIVLFSPGCASFDMFTNYKERGKQFKQAVREL